MVSIQDMVLIELQLLVCVILPVALDLMLADYVLYLGRTCTTLRSSLTVLTS